MVIRFNVRLWQRFRAIAAPYWLRDEKWPATGLLVLLVLLLLGQTGFSVLFNQLSGEFTSALAAKDAKGAEKLLPAAYKAIDKAAKRGIISRNTADRKKAVLARSLKRAA